MFILSVVQKQQQKKINTNKQKQNKTQTQTKHKQNKNTNKIPQIIKQDIPNDATVADSVVALSSGAVPCDELLAAAVGKDRLDKSGFGSSPSLTT